MAVAIPTLLCVLLGATGNENTFNINPENTTHVSKNPFIGKQMSNNVSFQHIVVFNKSALNSIDFKKLLICDNKLGKAASHVLTYLTFGMIIPLSIFTICYKLIHKFTRERYNNIMRAVGGMDSESRQLLEERENVAHNTLLITIFVLFLSLVIPLITEAEKWGNFTMPLEVYEVRHYLGSAGMLTLSISLCLLQSQFRYVCRYSVAGSHGYDTYFRERLVMGYADY